MRSWRTCRAFLMWLVRLDNEKFSQLIRIFLEALHQTRYLLLSQIASSDGRLQTILYCGSDNRIELSAGYFLIGCDLRQSLA